MEVSGNPLAQFTTNSFAANPYLAIMVGTFLGMVLMSTGIMVGLPVWVNMALLFSGILLVFGFTIGKIQYTLTHQGIQQQIRVYIPYTLYKKETSRFIKWNQVNSWKNDTDKLRTGLEYEYLKLYLNTSPGEIWITNQQNPDGFQQFRDAFIAFVKEGKGPSAEPLKTRLGTLDNPAPNTSVEMTQANPLKTQIHSTLHIREKKSFYHSPIAKALTVLCTLFTVLFIVIFAYKGMHFTNEFRLMFVLIPGTVYLIYRVFFRPKDIH